jgi:hypothetical protein
MLFELSSSSMKALQSTMQLNEFCFTKGIRQLQLVYYKGHWNQSWEKSECNSMSFLSMNAWGTYNLYIPKLIEINNAKKKKVQYSIIHEAQWNFLIHNKVKKWTSSKNSDFCPFLSCEEQGTLKNNKMKITKIQEFVLLHLIFKLCIKLLCQLWLCYACTCKVRRLRTPSLWIINPSFVNKIYLVKMVNLQLTLLKCNMNSNNWGNPSMSWFGKLESQ